MHLRKLFKAELTMTMKIKVIDTDENIPKIYFDGPLLLFKLQERGFCYHLLSNGLSIKNCKCVDMFWLSRAKLRRLGLE